MMVSCSCSITELKAQSPVLFSHLSTTTDGAKECDFYIFHDGEASSIGMKYFAVRANSEYQKWQVDKDVLLVTTGAFSSEWTDRAKPIGLCVDEGRVLNRSPRKEMDALVIEKKGALTVVDLDNERMQIDWEGEKLSVNPRDGSLINRVKFLHLAEASGWTVFQSQLLAGPNRNEAGLDLDYGNAAERRMLALASKAGHDYRIIVDLPQAEKLHRAAQIASQQLAKAGFTLHYLVNLDTGDRNLLYVKRDDELQKVSQVESNYADIAAATNLLVFYRR
jgi:hypothetical protein